MSASDDKPSNLHIAAPRQKRAVEYAVRNDGSMPARAFVEGLPSQTKSRLLAIFAHMAQNGEANISDQMFKHERDDIYTFKCKLDKRRIRLPCFRRGDRWIIAHGFIKPPKSKWPEEYFTLANEIKNEVERRENSKKKTT